MGVFFYHFHSLPPDCMLWRHPILQYTKDAITSPLSSLGTEVLQSEALKLFKCCHLFMTVQVNQLGIDYHVVLAQNALQQCLDMPELVDEFVCALVKQTTRLTGQKTGVQVNKKLGKQTKVSRKWGRRAWKFLFKIY